MLRSVQIPISLGASRALVRTAVLLAAIAGWPGPGQASSQVAAFAPAAKPGARLAVWADLGVRRLRSEVSITVDGATRVARFEIQEEFLNESGRVLEGDYLYPIPAGAVFTNLSLFVGETELRGEMLRAEDARRIYEEIVRRRKDPALIELVGNDLVRARVFPIEPGDTRKIILRYTQVLARDGDLVRLRFPRAAGMISPLERPVEPTPRPQLRRRPDEVPGFSLRARITSASRFATPVSPTHTIDIARRAGDVVEVSLPEGEGSEFVLLLPLARHEVGAGLLTHSPAPGSESGYFMLMFTPPPAAAEVSIPRDMTLVLDVSGSMSGFKIQQARSAIEQVLRGLRPDDRFRLITFASVVRSFSDQLVAASRSNIEAAVEYLRSVPADGSTNIHDALQQALAPQAAPDRLSLVVFLTDGLPTVAETDPVRIADMAARLRDGERVFAFGVGEDVNTYLLDRLVEGGRGAVSYVGPNEDVEEAVSSLSRKIGAPALADLRIVEAPVQLEEMLPGVLPDLFHGEELMLLGRYRGAGTGTLVLEGTRAGHTRRFEFELAFPRRRTEDGFVARLWAARKAGALSAQLRLHGPTPELINAIRDLGLRYGVLTEYTSYLVQEPSVIGTDRVFEMAELRVREAVAAPAAQTGVAAFKRARSSARLQRQASLDAADEALASVIGVGLGGRGEVASWRQLDRRIFVLRDQVWTDVSLAADAPELRIEPYSATWFELVNRFPGLRSAVALGEQVMIAGDGLTLILDGGSGSTLTSSDWRRLERAFARDRR